GVLKMGMDKDVADQAEKALEQMKPRRSGSEVSLGFSVNADKLVPLAGPMLQEVIETAQLGGGGLGGGSPKARAMNNFKQMGIALHTYASSYQDKLPPAVLTSPEGKPLF